MFELLHTDARRKANLRQDLVAILIAAGLLALALYGIARLEPTPAEPLRGVASTGGTTPPSPSASERPARRGGSSPAASGPRAPASQRAAPAGEVARPPGTSSSAPARAASRASTAESAPGQGREARSALPRIPGGAVPSGDVALGEGVTHTIPSRATEGAAIDVAARVAQPALGGVAARDSSSPIERREPPSLPEGVTTRTELALESATGDPAAFAIETAPPDSTSAPDTSPTSTLGTASAPGGSAEGRWRVTARTAGTHRLRLVAVDVRDSAGRTDTLAWRTMADVELPVDPDPSASAAGPLATARRVASEPLAGWLAACAASFVVGWLLRGRRREAPAEAAPDSVAPLSSAQESSEVEPR